MNCGSCDSFYIGQTGRSFRTRRNEHLKALNRDPPNSNYAEHLLETNHKYSNEAELEILHVAKKSKKLDCMEGYFIYCNQKTHPNKLLNKQLNFNSNPLYEEVMKYRDN